MMQDEDILKQYTQIKTGGKEPIRLLRDTTDMGGWSNIPPYMVMLLLQLDLLNDTVTPDNFITNKLSDRIRLNYLSVKGYAREQFVQAHNGIIDELKNILAGKIQEDKLKR